MLCAHRVFVLFGGGGSGFLKGGEDHFRQDHCAGGPDASTVDLWLDHTTADGLNGTYSAFLYARKAVALLEDFGRRAEANATAKMFIYLPWHDVHSPLQAPERFQYSAHFNDSYAPRLMLNAMANALDEGMRNVTNAIKAAGLWDDCLIVWSADNGGWLHTWGSSNYPLRGGKVTDFEGGVRAVSFAAGGYIPEHIRGSRFEGLISVADWYATFCYLAGVDHVDAPANTSVPSNHDSLNVWPALQVPNSTESPREEIFLSYAINDYNATDAGLIVGAHKIVCGHQANSGFWQSPVYPNMSSPSMDPPYERYDGRTVGCFPDCCLFDIRADESEYHDLREELPTLFKQMSTALAEHAKTVYQTRYAEPGTEACLTNAQAKAYYKGFIGPMCFGTLPPLPPPPPPPPPPPVFELRRGDGGAEECLLASDGEVRAGPCDASKAPAGVVAYESAHWIADALYGDYLAAVTGPSGEHQFVKVRSPKLTVEFSQSSHT